jgi:hypothetical protein
MNPAAIDPPSLVGKVICFVITNSEVEDDVSVLAGTGVWRDGALWVEFSEEAIAPWEVYPEWLTRIREIDESQTRDILCDADFFIPLTISSMPDGVDTESLIRTGLIWHASGREESEG